MEVTAFDAEVDRLKNNENGRLILLFFVLLFATATMAQRVAHDLDSNGYRYIDTYNTRVLTPKGFQKKTNSSLHSLKAGKCICMHTLVIVCTGILAFLYLKRFPYTMHFIPWKNNS